MFFEAVLGIEDTRSNRARSTEQPDFITADSILENLYIAEEIVDAKINDVNKNDDKITEVNTIEASTVEPKIYAAPAPVVTIEAEALVEVPVVKIEAEALAEVPVVKIEAEALAEVPVVKIEVEALAEVPVVNIEAEVLAEVPVVKIEAEVLAEVPVVKIEAEALAEVPVVKIEAEVLAEVPVVKIEAEVLAEVPVVTIEVEVLAEVPVVTVEAETLAEVPVVKIEAEALAEVQDVSTPAEDAQVSAEPDVVDTTNMALPDANVAAAAAAVAAAVAAAAAEAATPIGDGSVRVNVPQNVCKKRISFEQAIGNGDYEAGPSAAVSGGERKAAAEVKRIQHRVGYAAGSEWIRSQLMKKPSAEKNSVAATKKTSYLCVAGRPPSDGNSKGVGLSKRLSASKICRAKPQGGGSVDKAGTKRSVK